MPEPGHPGDPLERERRRPTLPVEAWGLIIVCVAFFVLQWMLFPHDRPPGWDESVYLSQVTPGAEALFFAGWRARGITLIVAPTIWAGASISELRLFLMVVSALGLGLALAVWRPVIGMAASVAAFLFACTWIALLNASQVMPNFWTAVLGLAAAGYTVRWNEDGRGRHAALASAALALTALVRPTEATVVFAVLGTFVLVNRRSWTALAALSAGLVIGWLPWIVEMSVRFGGPLEALRGAAAGHVEPAPVTQNVLRHLSYTNGELLSTAVPLPGVLWWVVLAALTVVGIVRAATRAERAAALVAACAALAVLIEYVVFVPVLAPRFLLPAYAFAAIPASIGLVSLVGARGMVRAAGVVVVLIAIPWAVWQAGVARRVETESTRVGRLFREVGQQIGRMASDDTCSFMSPAGFPQIQIASGCVGHELPRWEGPTQQELDRLGSGRESVFVIMPKPAPKASPLEAVRPIRARGPNRVWLIYQLPTTAPPDPGTAG